MVNAQQWLESQKGYNNKETKKIIFDSSSPSFDQAGELIITDYPSLEVIATTGSKDIKKITRVIISNCPQLKEVNITNFIDNHGLKIINCPNLENLYCGNNQHITDLDVSNFPNLKELQCWKNKLTKLDLTNNNKITVLGCSKNNLENLEVSNLENLEELDCSNNNLTKLDLSRLTNLKNLYCGDNYLSSLIYPSHPKKIINLNVINNNLPEQDLSFFSELVNLEGLWVGTSNRQNIRRGIYNRWIGSLEPLKNLTKLEKLDISNTDIDEGTEHLPKNLKEVTCSIYSNAYDKEISDRKVREIKKELECYTVELKRWSEKFDFQDWIKNKKVWEEKGFNHQEVKQLMEAGLKPNEWDYAIYLREQGHNFSKVRQAQIWLDFNYPKNGVCQKTNKDENQWEKSKGWNNQGKKREEVTKLDIGWEKLEGDLDLSDFPNLTGIDCRFNHLTGLNLSKNNKLTFFITVGDSLLKELDLKNNIELSTFVCHNTELTSLDLTNNIKLTILNCGENKLTSLKLPILAPLKELNCSNNNLIEQDLSILNRFVNLESLSIGSGDEKKKQQNIYNRFYGSLQPLEKLSKLRYLDIRNTDLNGDIEHLPSSLDLKKFYYSSEEIAEKLSILDWKKHIHEDFTKELIREWREKGFKHYNYTYPSDKDDNCKDWIDIGCTPHEASLADYLKNWKYVNKKDNLDLEKLRLEFSDGEWKKWKAITKDFTEKHQKEWKEQGFSYTECKEWINNTDLDINDVHYAKWLRDTKGKNAEWLVANFWDGKKLRKEYNRRDLQLSAEVIEQIKDFEYSYDFHPHVRLTREQELLIDELIVNKDLRERYKRCRLCQECGQPNTGYKWCRPCNIKHWKADFPNWTSGNSEIDKFIQKSQLEVTNGPKEILEWIPYEQFIDVEYLAEGGFGKVYKAKWTKGSIDLKIMGGGVREWKRQSNEVVVLKSLNNSQNITPDFLQEIAKHKLFAENYGNKIVNRHSIYDSRIVDCYGISQDPSTKNYLMVMLYVNNNLRQYLKNDYHSINFERKIEHLDDIARGLKAIHKEGLVHRDFHLGNILNNAGNSYAGGNWLITDLGLCRPANKQEKEGEIFGVLPYVAPEVLRGQSYTQASDIYSFGMVAYELLTGLPPYHDVPHDVSLAIKVCQGLRPQFQIKVPKFLEDLINKCWEADPLKRPKASELEVKLINRQEISRQCLEAEALNQALLTEIKSPAYKLHPQAVYHSKAINTKRITELLQQQKTEECHTNFSEELTLNINLDELNIQEEQGEGSTQAQVEVLSKNN